MLEEINRNKLSIQSCIESAKDKTSKFRLFGSDTGLQKLRSAGQDSEKVLRNHLQEK
jgi:hypothetical protein